MDNTLSFFGSGILFGLAAGMSPGPLMALVISETLKHNTKEGIKVSIAPLITDFPIVGITLLALAKLSSQNLILGSISILGALYIAYLGYESLRVKGIEVGIQDVKPKSIKKGVILNALSPHPYLFWIAVGGPIVFQSLDLSLFAAVLFIGSFYLFLVGSKIVLSILVGRSRHFLKSKSYLFIIRTLGILLFIFALIFLRDGLRLLNVL